MELAAILVPRQHDEHTGVPAGYRMNLEVNGQSLAW